MIKVSLKREEGEIQVQGEYKKQRKKLVKSKNT